MSVRFEDLPDDVRAEIEAERQAARERAAAAEPEFQRQLDELTAKVDAARGNPAPDGGLDLTAAVEAALEAVHGQDEGWETERREAEAAVRAAAPHVLRTAAEPIATTAAAHLAAMVNPGDGQGILRDMARRAVLRAFGCTCRDHSDQGAVYVEDITCPIHARALADEIGGVMRQPRLSTVPTVETRTDTIATQEIGGGR